MSTNFNELLDAETERLACLAEECAEVIQIVGKILRHGYESTHPDNPDGPNNRDMLNEEIGHVMAILKMMDEDLWSPDINEASEKKRDKIKAYLHHQ